MAIPTEQGGAGAAFAKLVDLGDVLIGACGSDPKYSKRQARNFDTGRPATKDDGTARLEEILHLVTMPGTTARLGDADHGYQVIEPGTHVRFALQGFKWGQVIEARKNLPAFAAFRAGQTCSSDVYSIALAGWSAETKNAAAATKAGFTVVEGRIVLRTQADKDRYVLAQSRTGGNTNPAKDLEISIRRIDQATEKRWEQAADDLFRTKPWETPVAAPAPAGEDPYGDTPHPADDDIEPF